MDEFLRQLPHDNDELLQQWPDIFDKCTKLLGNVSEADQATHTMNCLNALADYLMADHEEMAPIKLTLVVATMERLTGGPLPPANELASLFCRLLDASSTDDCLKFKLMQDMYYRYRLGEQLCNQECVESIERILCCLQKHAFTTEEMSSDVQERWKEFLAAGIFRTANYDRNKLNNEEIMLRMRRTFQLFFR